MYFKLFDLYLALVFFKINCLKLFFIKNPLLTKQIAKFYYNKKKKTDTFISYSFIHNNTDFNFFYYYCDHHLNQDQKKKMDSEEFRRRGKEMVDYIADYLENIK